MNRMAKLARGLLSHQPNIVLDSIFAGSESERLSNLAMLPNLVAKMWQFKWPKNESQRLSLDRYKYWLTQTDATPNARFGSARPARPHNLGPKQQKGAQIARLSKPAKQVTFMR